MTQNLSPKSVRMAMEGAVDRALLRLAVDRALWGDGFWDVYMAVYGAVHGAMEGAVSGAVSGAVVGAVSGAAHPHPNLDRLVHEVRQARKTAA